MLLITANDKIAFLYLLEINTKASQRVAAARVVHGVEFRMNPTATEFASTCEWAGVITLT